MKESSDLKKKLLLGALLGALTYVILFGFSLLDVTNVSWLYAKADLTQHYNGWMFYRNSAWHFPIGLMNTVTYPDYYSVVYTDAIPLFAVFFKLLSPILPSSFQYFGLWGLFCYMLQGTISACILGRYIKSWGALSLSIAFLTFSPWMLHRLYMHSSLAAHWLLLLCILISLEGNKLSIRQYILRWCGVFGLAASIHVYFIPMCAVFLGCNTLYYLWCKRQNTKAAALYLITAVIPLLVAVVVLWVLGAFYGTVSYAKGGLGEASANLNFLFNSVGKSNFFPALPHPYTVWTEESFGYMGLGVFVLLFISIICFISNRKCISSIMTNRREIIFTVLLLFIFLWLATAPIVAWNNHLFFRWLLIDGIRWLLEVFRSLGRFVWPICYIVLLIALVGVNLRLTNKWKVAGTAILFVCLMLQIADFSNMVRDKVGAVKNVIGYEHLVPEHWDSFIDNYTHIYNFEFEDWQDISTYAGSNNLTMNQTYLARIDDNQLLEDMNQMVTELQQGNIDAETLYILPRYWSEDDWKIFSEMNVYQIDGYCIATLNPLNGMEMFLKKEGIHGR